LSWSGTRARSGTGAGIRLINLGLLSRDGKDTRQHACDKKTAGNELTSAHVGSLSVIVWLLRPWVPRSCLSDSYFLASHVRRLIASRSRGIADADRATITGSFRSDDSRGRNGRSNATDRHNRNDGAARRTADAWGAACSGG